MILASELIPIFSAGVLLPMINLAPMKVLTPNMLVPVLNIQEKN